jgi:hypothetical protein
MIIDADANTSRTFIGNLMNRLKGALARRKEIRRLDSPEIESVARELNLSKTEFCALTLQPSNSLPSLGKRLSNFGLHEDAVAADTLRDLQRVCSLCKSKARCARDLRHERRATPAKYCPNEQTLRTLADERNPQPSQILSFPAAQN